MNLNFKDQCGVRWILAIAINAFIVVSLGGCLPATTCNTINHPTFSIEAVLLPNSAEIFVNSGISIECPTYKFDLPSFLFYAKGNFIVDGNDSLFDSLSLSISNQLANEGYIRGKWTLPIGWSFSSKPVIFIAIVKDSSGYILADSLTITDHGGSALH